MIDAAGADFLMGGGSSKYAIGTLLEHSNRKTIFFTRRFAIWNEKAKPIIELCFGHGVSPNDGWSFIWTNEVHVQTRVFNTGKQPV